MIASGIRPARGNLAIRGGYRLLVGFGRLRSTGNGKVSSDNPSAKLKLYGVMQRSKLKGASPPCGNTGTGLECRVSKDPFYHTKGSLILGQCHVSRESFRSDRKR